MEKYDQHSSSIQNISDFYVSVGLSVYIWALREFGKAPTSSVQPNVLCLDDRGTHICTGEKCGLGKARALCFDLLVHGSCLSLSITIIVTRFPIDCP